MLDLVVLLRVLFGGSFIAVANHLISWVLSIILGTLMPVISFIEAKKRGSKMSEDTIK